MVGFPLIEEIGTWLTRGDRCDDDPFWESSTSVHLQMLSEPFKEFSPGGHYSGTLVGHSEASYWIAIILEQGQKNPPRIPRAPYNAHTDCVPYKQTQTFIFT